MYGFLNYSREVPDGKDINRSFPGSKTGSLAARVAWHITHDVIPFIDYGVDFHTGGAMRTNYPQVRCVMQEARNVELAAAFHAPFTIDSPFRPHSLRQTAAKKDKNIIVYEGGESVRFDQHAIEEGVEGTLRLMKHLNMITHAPEPKQETGSSGAPTGFARRMPDCFNQPLIAEILSQRPARGHDHRSVW